jgi:alginate O-acetyltransferase complex protein AlgI
MLFNSFTYMLFLPLVVAIYWLCPRWMRPALLLVASYFFYMNWIPVYGLLILSLTVVNYFAGLAIHRFANHKKALLAVGLIFNLGCLCYFKYASFVVDSLWRVAEWCTHVVAPAHFAWSAPANLPSEPVLNILLPLGISFFTFEFIHYIVDVYRGSAPIKNFMHFALFGAFFPTQIAGPIKRFQDFTKQLVVQPVFSSSNFSSGVALIFLGLFKKMVLADNMALIVNAGFAHSESLGTLEAWLVTAGFTMQLFFDFSGYTDIGRGSALLFGYSVPQNFNYPFLASSLTDFWHRWHMSLSTWLRDYLFIPLGGSRVSPWRMRFNLLLTMILGGLWHGAAWHYVVWGAFHGIGLVICRSWQDFTAGISWLSRLKPNALWHWTGWLITMVFLTFAGLFFRADNMTQVVQMAARMLSIHPASELTNTLLTSVVPAVLCAYAAYLLIAALARRQFAPALANNRLVAWWNNSLPAHAAACFALGLLIMGFAPGKVTPFIYFQF